MRRQELQLGLNLDLQETHISSSQVISSSESNGCSSHRWGGGISLAPVRGKTWSSLGPTQQQISILSHGVAANMLDQNLPYAGLEGVSNLERTLTRSSVIPQC